MYSTSSFEQGFSLFSVMFTVVFVLVIGVFVVTIVKSIRISSHNHASPRLTVPARVVGKRDEVHRYRHDAHMHYSSTYYVTFEVESGDRMELEVEGKESGLIAEGDSGMLTFQGTRFLGFERK